MTESMPYVTGSRLETLIIDYKCGCMHNFLCEFYKLYIPGYGRIPRSCESILCLLTVQI